MRQYRVEEISNTYVNTKIRAYAQAPDGRMIIKISNGDAVKWVDAQELEVVRYD